MSIESGRSSVLRTVLIAAGLAIVIFGLKAAAAIVSPIILALVVAICVTPLLRWLQTKGLPGWLALLLALLILLGILVGLIAFLGWSISRLAGVLPTYLETGQETVAEGQALLEGMLAGRGIEVDTVVNFDLFQPEKLVQIVSAFAASLADLIGDAVWMILILIFVLIESLGVPAKIRTKIRIEDHAILVRAGELNEEIRQYMWITTGTGILAGLGDTILLLILGVEFPVMWGILAWLTNYIPSVGFWIALIPPAILALLEYGWERALIVVVGYVLINGAVENGLKPRFYERGLNLSPLVTILSLFLWAWILGPTGAILAVPLTMVVMKLFLAGSEETSWVLALMGGSGQDGDSPEQEPAG